MSEKKMSPWMSKVYSRIKGIINGLVISEIYFKRLFSWEMEGSQKPGNDVKWRSRDIQSIEVDVDYMTKICIKMKLRMMRNPARKIVIKITMWIL